MSLVQALLGMSSLFIGCVLLVNFKFLKATYFQIKVTKKKVDAIFPVFGIVISAIFASTVLALGEISVGGAIIFGLCTGTALTCLFVACIASITSFEANTLTHIGLRDLLYAPSVPYFKGLEDLMELKIKKHHVVPYKSTLIVKVEQLNQLLRKWESVELDRKKFEEEDGDALILEKVKEKIKLLERDIMSQFNLVVTHEDYAMSKERSIDIKSVEGRLTTFLDKPSNEDFLFLQRQRELKDLQRIINNKTKYSDSQRKEAEELLKKIINN